MVFAYYQKSLIKVMNEQSNFTIIRQYLFIFLPLVDPTQLNPFYTNIQNIIKTREILFLFCSRENRIRFVIHSPLPNSPYIPLFGIPFNKTVWPSGLRRLTRILTFQAEIKSLRRRRFKSASCRFLVQLRLIPIFFGDWKEF